MAEHDEGLVESANQPHSVDSPDFLSWRSSFLDKHVQKVVIDRGGRLEYTEFEVKHYRSMVNRILIRGRNEEMLVRAAVSLTVAAQSGPPMRTLAAMLDLVPVPKLRKRLKKLLADQADHARSLQVQGRPIAAGWIAASTWLLCGWYVLKAPLDSLLAAVRKSSGA